MHDWMSIQRQIEGCVEKRIDMQQRFFEAIRKKVDIFEGELSANWEKWKSIVLLSSKTAPDFDEAPSTTYPVDPNPQPGVMIATDGSQIFPNKHEISPLALITVSRIKIDYKNYQDMPLMDSKAWVLMSEDLRENLEKEREISMEDLVSDRRTLLEMDILAEIAEEQAQVENTPPIIALCDGSLILWRLAERFEKKYEKTIVEDFVKHLHRLQSCGALVAGYISGSNSREVMNLIQLVEESIQPDLFDNEIDDPIVIDTVLFGRILKPGQRSTLFHSQSKILKQKYGEQRISYFYLNVDDEIAKVEIPQWIAQDKQLVDQTAAHCLRQAKLGGGYPVVLAESHEHAVVRGPDRETFYTLVEESLRRKQLDPHSSAKQMRKRTAIL
jgi:NurA domain-containing protein